MKEFQIFLVYLILVNMIAFLLFGLDKRKAQMHRWRISEKALFIPAILGGSIGAILGMHLFHHKTKHWYFRFGLPLILALQLAVFFLLLYEKV
ncbi:MAG: DUF1294 domain-containing protein [Oscillospiraceae bacterium]|nr:DUF1294 domain-containing protein [Oscillospiraceae bacterium]MBO7421857.1 DUF1294 domain-containing protein [Oscillospiraceae bacterium]MBO7727309.1 DUF1294 domain-containing protein [Oscillospiraceae bacterium]MBP5168797.1 DUF1294 domain-containing protein [Oscillospiraceae bacterium]